jgi:hypothetical protein
MKNQRVVAACQAWASVTAKVTGLHEHPFRFRMNAISNSTDALYGLHESIGKWPRTQQDLERYGLPLCDIVKHACVWHIYVYDGQELHACMSLHKVHKITTELR